MGAKWIKCISEEILLGKNVHSRPEKKKKMTARMQYNHKKIFIDLFKVISSLLIINIAISHCVCIVCFCKVQCKKKIFVDVEKKDLRCTYFSYVIS